MPSFGDELGRLIPHMRRFARAIVRGHSMQTADDLVQETVVLAMRAERLARGPHLRSWCFASLIRVHRQWEQTAQGRGNSFLSPQTSDAKANGPVAFVPREIGRLDMMSVDCREVLLLTVLVGMNYAQVAETLHITVEAVLMRLDVARNGLGRESKHAPATMTPSSQSGHRSARSAQYLQLVK